MTAPEFDPRATVVPQLETLDLTLINQALPCGKIACRPFAEACIQSSDLTPVLAANACGWMMATDVLAKEVEDRRTEAAENRLAADLAACLADKLSIDSELNILTFNSLKVLYELMEKAGLLKRLAEAGFTAEMLFLDLDWLGGHNELGDHEGGDVALREVVNAIRPLYRRKMDFMGISGYQTEAEQNVAARQSFSQVGRYERGDEIVVMSFISPRNRARDRRHPAEGLEARREQIIEALDPVVAQYPLVKQKSLEGIQQELARKGCNIEYEVVDGTVYAPVSAAFAIVRHRIPRTLAEFERLAKLADGNMHGAKSARTGKSRGAIASFLPA
jgi:GGDEF domain-containing protein